MKSPSPAQVCSPTHHAAVVDFLFELRDELQFKERHMAEEIADILFEKGGLLASFAGDRIVCLCGYFLGDPANDFADDDVAFIYVRGVHNSI